MVLVEVRAGGKTGIGYTYADRAAADVIHDDFRELLIGCDALETGKRFADMQGKIRNMGRDGITSMAISAVDIALWDLKGKLFDAPVCTLLGTARNAAPLYGSGGFTSYTVDRLREQLSGWVNDGIPRVKMKVGRNPDDDVHRVEQAREAIGGGAQLFVDANGAYSRKQALRIARSVREFERKLVRRARLPSGFRGLAADSRTRSRVHGCRLRRIRLRALSLLANAWGANGRLSSGRRIALRRIQRVSWPLTDCARRR